MDVEEPASKGHGFFGLLDWGKSSKSKRQLFSGSGGDSPTQGSSVDWIMGGKLMAACQAHRHTRCILGNAISLKESSAHSCSSSVIDDEACRRRGPTIVARLLVLDFMPTASSSGSYPMPFSGQHTIQKYSP